MKMERITKSKKLVTLVLSILMFALTITGVFVSTGSTANTVASAESTNKAILSLGGEIVNPMLNAMRLLLQVTMYRCLKIT